MIPYSQLSEINITSSLQAIQNEKRKRESNIDGNKRAEKIKQKFKQKKMRLRQMRQQKFKNTGKGITRNMEKKLVQSQK